MLSRDIEIAQRIVSNSHSNVSSKNTFHDESVIYKKTNEQIQLYQDFLKNRKKVLSVIASGDQIINSILEGTIEIDAFDISVFPKYFLFLKLASIISLTKEQYLDMFFRETTTSEIYDDYYFDLIRNDLDDNVRRFWDSLFGFFDWYDIYNSTLFSSEIVLESHALKQNKYLLDSEYKRLKSLIPKVNISPYLGDILDIYKSFNGSYDLVYLSNILSYVDKQQFREMFYSLPLNEQGIILNYLYEIKDSIGEYFKHPNVSVHQFSNDKAGLLLYKRN